MDIQAVRSSVPAGSELSLASHDKALIQFTRPGSFTARATLQWGGHPDARADLIFRASELSYGEEGNDPEVGHNFFLGYSIQLSNSRVVLSRHSYDERILAAEDTPLAPNTPHAVVVSWAAGHISVSVDGKVSLEATDPLPHLRGDIGLRANVGEAHLLDLVMEQE